MGASLELASGERFEADAPPISPFAGEVVFTTGMTGYIETLTDPSFAGQILIFTYPLIGNYGIHEGWESDRVQVAGVVVNWASPELERWLDVPLLTGVDTRALTKRLRSGGSTLGRVGDVPFVDPNEEDLVARVGRREREFLDRGFERLLVVVDCGMKRNILRHLEKLECNLLIVPHDDDFSQEEYDAVMVSNGPGDPSRCEKTIAILRRVMEREKPLHGICLGMQLIALAAGASTYKLRFGHRGQNQPVRDRRSGRCLLTSQNHGYGVEEESLPEGWMVTYEHLNDGSVAGIRHKELPFAAVQFHPEAAPGPLDAEFLFREVM
jgi:carbamoyl-phosphate synthase small subunit